MDNNILKFFRRILLALFFSLQLLTSAAYAEEKTPCQKIPIPIVGECFSVHGRLSFYVGTPAFRIWVVGTHHLLNVTDWWAKSSAGTLPKNVYELLNDDFLYGTEIFGDYEVCPLQEEKEGQAQSICIERASNLVSSFHK